MPNEQPPQVKFHIAGASYGPEEAFELRQELINLRDESLAQNDFEWSVKLSHSIALMFDMGVHIWGNDFAQLTERNRHNSSVKTA